MLTIVVSILLPGVVAPVSAQTRQPLPRATDTPFTSPLTAPGAPTSSDAAPELDASRFDNELVQAQIHALLDAKVDAWMAEMPVEDKVGQLFVVNFPGNDTGINSDIALLIHAYRIGGVVISPKYGNFTNQKDADTPRDVADLTNRLQALAYGYLLGPDEELPAQADLADLAADLPTLGASMREADRLALNIPLLVAVEQTGDDAKNTYLRRRFTPLPSQMALGAAWTPELTRQVGEIVGRELGAVGVNVLLGPNLDVLVQPRPDAVGGLGIDMYGGNSFWVSEMGRAYVGGVHSGSDGRVLTTARHFPGQGDVDRLPDQEVAIVQTSADDLQAIALPPFKAVTDGLPGQAGKPEVTDMLMPANVRYSGLQGTGDDLTTPLSLSIALDSFMEAESFSTWRESGLLMTNALGLPALRRIYAGESPEAMARSLAFNAFAAGNDLLYLGEYGEDGTWESEMANLRSTIGFFQEQYRADSNFAASVDQAVRLILRAKLRLYYPEDLLRTEALAVLDQATISATVPLTRPVTEIDAVLLPDHVVSTPMVPLADILTPAENLMVFDADDPARADGLITIRQAARDSITVLHPELTVAGDSLPAAPKAGNKILIFTDSRLTQECDGCTAEVAVGPEEMEEIILRLYGQEGTGQILEEDITSLTFSELAEALDAEPVDIVSNGAATTAADAAASTPSPVLPVVPDEPLDGVEGDLPEQPAGTVEEPEAVIEQNPVDAAINEADWVIFNMLDVDAGAYPASDAVKRYLRERAPQNENQTIVVMALQAPYFLDATEISQLSMYLGVYASSQPFLENAVRVLFRSYNPVGAPPVAVAGTRFSSLSERLSADPLLPLALTVLFGDEELPAAAEENPVPAVNMGESVRVQVGPIMDHNNHIVPDGTRVDVIITYDGSDLAMTMPPSETRNGIAVRDVVLDRAGMLSIAATSGSATTAEPFRLQVIDPQPATPPPAAPAESATAVLEERVPVADGTPQPAEDEEPQSESNVVAMDDHANPATLLVALFTMLITLSLLLIVQIRILPRSVLVHNLLWGVVVGLGAYVAYAVGLIPGAELLYRSIGVWAVSLVVFLGMIIPMLWLQLSSVRD